MLKICTGCGQAKGDVGGGEHFETSVKTCVYCTTLALIPPPHATLLRYTVFHSTAPHNITFHEPSSHHITQHYSIPHSTTLHNTALHEPSFHCITSSARDSTHRHDISNNSRAGNIFAPNLLQLISVSNVNNNVIFADLSSVITWRCELYA